MSYPRSTNTPLFSPDSVPDFTATYSSFEHSQPGFQFLSNDPLSKAASRQQQQKQRKPHKDNAPPADTIKSRYPGSDDSDFVDVLYIVDSSGKTTVTDISTPETALAASEQHAPPSQLDNNPGLKACPPPHIGAFELPSTTIPTNSAAHILLGSEADDLEEANELDYYAKLMFWWPTAEADELKVERM